ncbi:MAG: hypothetical protein WKF59_05285 [Chitinophagaceae bacterium]
MLRSGVNILDEDRKQRRPFSTANFLRGYYKEQAITDFEVNNDFYSVIRIKYQRILLFLPQ